MKIKDLIKKLNEFDADAYVAATWEGIIITNLWLYPSVDGVILIDVNEDFSWRDEYKYKSEILKRFNEDK